MSFRLDGLIAATHTPMTNDGSLALDPVARQAEFLAEKGVSAVFIGGTTGESHSLTVEERRALARRWVDVVKGSPLQVVVHVGSNCLTDARALAEQAQTIGAHAISALAPSYFKPSDVSNLVECCAEVAAAAPDLPFYYYDIPPLTGIHLSMPDFLERAATRIPNLRGIKFSYMDLVSYQRCLACKDRAYDIPWGVDEALLGALALGCSSAVGSTYNFAAPVYLRLIKAFRSGDLESARNEQWRSVQIVQLLASFGFMAAAKALMVMLGVDVGPPRLPHQDLSVEQKAKLQAELEVLGFFDWIR